MRKKQMRLAIERIRKLHENHNGYCLNCLLNDDDYEKYPCSTIRALDGEQ